MKRLFSLSLILGLYAGSAHAGKIIAGNDDWTLSSWQWNSTSASTYATNVMNWFGGGTGTVLAYDPSNYYIFGPEFQQTLTTAGYTVETRAAAQSFTAADLAGYRALFLGGDGVDQTVLTNYVRNGGNVYLAVGVFADQSEDPRLWNTFLGNFGLTLASGDSGFFGDLAINGGHPIFATVSTLAEAYGRDVLLSGNPSDPPFPGAQIITSADGSRSFGVYQSAPAGAPTPEPATFGLIGLAMAAGAASRLVRRLQARRPV
jgi:hypothetical protein